MKKRILSYLLTLALVLSLLPAFALPATAAEGDLPALLWVAPSDTNGLPARIDVYVSGSSTTTSGRGNNKTTTTTFTSLLCLPGNIDATNLFLSWDDGLSASPSTGGSYASGICPAPGPDNTVTYTFTKSRTIYTYVVTTYQGSTYVPAVFIEVDESGDNPTIAQMDGDETHETTCTGRINIAGKWYEMPKIKGRGNATWEFADDKRPYNITLGEKIKFPGVDSAKTKKWSFLAENFDHSLLGNRAGYHLAHELGIGQDTASADVWMNGEYQGCYTITPKTDSFVTDDGYMIEQDNYLETKTVANGGDPQFELEGLKTTVSGWSSVYNVITVKKMGDNLLTVDGEFNDSPENIEAVAAGIQTWLQAAWNAIRSEDGYNSEGKYYTEYIDIESFARMYLVHEYVKSYDVCAGSILFHRDGQGEGDKLIAGPLWDLDNAMGSTYQNERLGQADDRNHGDRRSAEGDFIPLVTEYKTSIYKTISKHPDFMAAVYHQYNLNRKAFDDLYKDYQQMMDEIEASARMNFYKVKELHTDNPYASVNNHKYSTVTTLGSEDYSQTYQATTNSKTDWPIYAENMKTYITVRSQWFYGKFYNPDDPANCDHEFEDVVTPPTCTTEGYTTHTCPKCGTTYQDTPTPIIPHDYQDGVCTVCGQTLLNVTISCSPGASVTVYDTQDVTGPSTPNAELVHPRSSDTGFIDCGGDGQVNFVVELAPGFALDSVTAAPDGSYKALKGPEDTNIENGYRLTKVKGDVTITVTAHDARETFQVVYASDVALGEGDTGTVSSEKVYTFYLNEFNSGEDGDTRPFLDVVYGMPDQEDNKGNIPLWNVYDGTYNGSKWLYGGYRFASLTDGALTLGAYAEDVPGNKIVPEADMVYYVKNVDIHYLAPYYKYTYINRVKLVTGLWNMSILDDLNYSAAGFLVWDAKYYPDENRATTSIGNPQAYPITYGYKKITVNSYVPEVDDQGNTVYVQSKSVAVEPKSLYSDAGASARLTFVGIEDIFGDTFMSSIYANRLKAVFSVAPYWVTKDGISVLSQTYRVITIHPDAPTNTPKKTTQVSSKSLVHDYDDPNSLFNQLREVLNQ